jgi:serine/threonine-protein kinase SRPK3
MEAARDEVDLLKQITEGDPDNKKHCLHMIDNFKLVGPNGIRFITYFFFLI